ncbi:MAG: tRNA (adenosine(37)-N6)-threonylcarbamoyltransferase complex ATPase subunit type 1 TsaE [Lachnospiraceae bacterium]|nr:tRNA (adenosine(37)-N6)-threonylcarbamoyltransferase complex ATPase subunit type 1 TsaE [Lachnospiraceae bacterium]
MVLESQNEKDTYQLGYEVGENAEPGDVYCLDGDLGVGKTVFAAGFAKGLGIGTPICSPTFTILQTYEEGRIPLYHFDVYRIEDVDEMDEIGFDEYAFGDGACIIEWGQQIAEILPETTHYITIEKDPEKGFDYRKITIT